MQFQEVVSAAVHSFEEFHYTHLSPGISFFQPSQLSLSWFPPAVGYFKINFDAALAKQRCEGAIAAVFRDSTCQPYLTK